MHCRIFAAPFLVYLPEFMPVAFNSSKIKKHHHRLFICGGAF
jgi:hypothetical protein